MSQNVRWRQVLLLVLASLMYFFVNFQRAAIPGALFNQLQQEYDLSASGVASLGSGFTYIYAIAQLIVGLVIGRFGWIKSVRLGGLFFVLGALLFPLAGSFQLAYICRLLTGLGAGCIYLSIVQMTMETFPDKFSMALAVNLIIGFAGGVVANAPLTAAEEVFGWKKVMLSVGCALSVLYIVWILMSLGIKKLDGNSDCRFGSVKEVIRRPGNWYIWVFNWVNFGLFYVVQTVIGKKYLEDFSGFTSSGAAMVFSVTGIIAAFSGIFQAYFSALCGGRKAVFCRGATIISFSVFSGQIIMLLVGGSQFFSALLFCLLAATATMSALTIPLLREINPDSDFGLAAGAMNFGNYMAVAIFGDLAGFLIGIYPARIIDGVKVYGTSSYMLLFAVLLVFVLPAMTCAWLIKDKK